MKRLFRVFLALLLCLTMISPALADLNAVVLGEASWVLADPPEASAMPTPMPTGMSEGDEVSTEDEGLSSEGEEPTESTDTPQEQTEEPDMPTEEPAIEITPQPTAEVSPEPTAEPTIEPTLEPTLEPTEEPGEGIVLIEGYEELLIDLPVGDMPLLLGEGYTYFRFAAVESRTVRMETLGEADTKAYLYHDPTQAPLEYAEDGGAGDNFLLEFDAQAGQIYILAVAHWGSALVDVTVRVTLIEEPMVDGKYLILADGEETVEVAVGVNLDECGIIAQFSDRRDIEIPLGTVLVVDKNKPLTLYAYDNYFGKVFVNWRVEQYDGSPVTNEPAFYDSASLEFRPTEDCSVLAEFEDFTADFGGRFEQIGLNSVTIRVDQPEGGLLSPGDGSRVRSVSLWRYRSSADGETLLDDAMIASTESTQAQWIVSDVELEQGYRYAYHLEWEIIDGTAGGYNEEGIYYYYEIGDCVPGMPQAGKLQLAISQDEGGKGVSVSCEAASAFVWADEDGNSIKWQLEAGTNYNNFRPIALLEPDGSKGAATGNVEPLTYGSENLYRIRAISVAEDGQVANTGPYSKVVSLTCPAPKVATLTVQPWSDGGVLLLWSRSTGGGYEKLTVLQDGQVVMPAQYGPNYAVLRNAINEERNYRFQIQLRDEPSDHSIESNPVVYWPLQNKVRLTAQAHKDGTVYLQWSALADGVEYVVQRRAKDEEWVTLTDGSISSVHGSPAVFQTVDAPSALGKRHQYRVLQLLPGQGEDHLREDAVSNTVNVTPKATRVSLAAQATGIHSLRLDWTPVEGAQGYIIHIAIDKAMETPVTGYPKTVAGEEFQHLAEGLQGGSTYYCKVEFFTRQQGGQPIPIPSSISSLKRVKTAWSKPVVSGEALAHDKVRLTWPPVQDARRYWVQRKNGSGWLDVGQLDAVEFTGTIHFTETISFEGRTATVRYRVYADAAPFDPAQVHPLQASESISPASKAVAVGLGAGKGSLQVTSRAPHKITLQWATAEMAQEPYDVQRSTNKKRGFETIARSIVSGIYTDEALERDKTYYYRVTPSGEERFSMTAEAKAALDSPKVVQYPCSDELIAVEWTATPGADGYILRSGWDDADLFYEDARVGADGTPINGNVATFADNRYSTYLWGWGSGEKFYFQVVPFYTRNGVIIEDSPSEVYGAQPKKFSPEFAIRLLENPQVVRSLAQTEVSWMDGAHRGNRYKVEIHCANGAGKGYRKVGLVTLDSAAFIQNVLGDTDTRYRLRIVATTLKRKKIFSPYIDLVEGDGGLVSVVDAQAQGGTTAPLPPRPSDKQRPSDAK